MFFVCTILTSTRVHAQEENDTQNSASERDSIFYFDSIPATQFVKPTERVIPDSLLERLRRDEAFWYANTAFKKKRIENNTPRSSFLQQLIAQSWFRQLLWFLMIGSFCGVLLLFLSKSNISLFRTTPKLLVETKDVDYKTIFSIPYETEISKAILAGDYRSAIRLYYLQMLTLLSDKKKITYKEEFTNSDYLSQLYNTPYYTSFKMLTRHFDYAWYGRFLISPEAFNNIEAEFKTFKNNMDI